MPRGVLVLNAGSSSLKFALYRDTGVGEPEPVLSGQIEAIGLHPRFRAEDASGSPLDPPSSGSLRAVSDHDGALSVLLDWLERREGGLCLAAAGHRVVHGGSEFTKPVVITPGVVGALAGLEPLAPHHQPHNVAAIRAVTGRLPELPQVACFDTAFHATQPGVARHLGLPRGYEERGVRRYGFHGLSYEYIVGAFQAVTGAAPPGRLVVAHLGNGASMSAIKDGRSVATTMGFSTLDGLPMGTRSGSMDPGALLHLIRVEGLGFSELETLLYDRCGLLGISGISPDMRVLLASDDPKAAEAVDYYCYAIMKELGSLAAVLGGLDALVFTGGVGENAAPVRAAVCGASRWLGLALDEDANAQGGPMITLPESPVPAWVIATDEALVVARHTVNLLRAAEEGAGEAEQADAEKAPATPAR